MPLTLWRGSELLGSLHIRESKLVGAPHPERFVSALLLRGESNASLPGGMIQRRVDIFPGRPVLQHPVGPFIAGERHDDSPAITVRAWPARSSSAHEPNVRGVAPDQQLSVRDDTGREISTRYITLREFRPLAGTEPTVMEGYPAEALRDGSVWLVSAGLESVAPVAS